MPTSDLFRICECPLALPLPVNLKREPNDHHGAIIIPDRYLQLLSPTAVDGGHSIPGHAHSLRTGAGHLTLPKGTEKRILVRLRGREKVA